jgi:hypothetical protein
MISDYTRINIDSLSVSGPENVIYTGTKLQRDSSEHVYGAMLANRSSHPHPILSLSLLCIFGGHYALLMHCM